MVSFTNGLSPQHAAQLATLPAPQLDEWIGTGLFCFTNARTLDVPAFLAILLVKLLRSNNVPLEAIRPLSRFLSERTSEEIEDEVRHGHTALLGLGGRVAFASPECRVTNETGAAVFVVSVDVVALMRHARFLLDSRHTNWLLRN